MHSTLSGSTRPHPVAWCKVNASHHHTRLACPSRNSYIQGRWVERRVALPQIATSAGEEESSAAEVPEAVASLWKDLGPRYGIYTTLQPYASPFGLGLLWSWANIPTSRETVAGSWSPGVDEGSLLVVHVPLALTLSHAFPSACPEAHACPPLARMFAAAREGEVAWEAAIGAALVWAVRQGDDLLEGFWARCVSSGLLPPLTTLTSALTMTGPQLRQLQDTRLLHKVLDWQRTVREAYDEYVDTPEFAAACGCSTTGPSSAMSGGQAGTASTSTAASAAHATSTAGGGGSGGGSGVTWEEFVWAVATVESRAYGVKCGATELQVLVPVADVANHQPGAPVVARPYMPVPAGQYGSTGGRGGQDDDEEEDEEGEEGEERMDGLSARVSRMVNATSGIDLWLMPPRGEVQRGLQSGSGAGSASSQRRGVPQIRERGELGTPFCTNYGEKSNRELVDQYGFVLPGNVQDRLEVLCRQYGSLSTGDSSSGSGASGSDGDDAAVGILSSSGGSQCVLLGTSRDGRQAGMVYALRRDAVMAAVTRLLQRWGHDSDAAAAQAGSGERAGALDGEAGTGAGANAAYLWLSWDGEEEVVGEGEGADGDARVLARALAEVLGGTGVEQGCSAQGPTAWEGVRHFFARDAWARRLRASAASLVEAYPWRSLAEFRAIGAAGQLACAEDAEHRLAAAGLLGSKAPARSLAPQLRALLCAPAPPAQVPSPSLIISEAIGSKSQASIVVSSTLMADSTAAAVASLTADISAAAAAAAADIAAAAAASAVQTKPLGTAGWQAIPSAAAPRGQVTATTYTPSSPRSAASTAPTQPPVQPRAQPQSSAPVPSFQAVTTLPPVESAQLQVPPAASDLDVDSLEGAGDVLGGLDVFSGGLDLLSDAGSSTGTTNSSTNGSTSSASGAAARVAVPVSSVLTMNGDEAATSGDPPQHTGNRRGGPTGPATKHATKDPSTRPVPAHELVPQAGQGHEARTRTAQLYALERALLVRAARALVTELQYGLRS